MEFKFVWQVGVSVILRILVHILFLSLVCAVSYASLTGEKMYFRKFFKFQVIMNNKLSLIPLPPIAPPPLRIIIVSNKSLTVLSAVTFLGMSSTFRNIYYIILCIIWIIPDQCHLFLGRCQIKEWTDMLKFPLLN